MHVAFITLGAYGHLNPTLPFVAELVRRGVRVTFFTTESFRKDAALTGAEFAPYDSILTNQGRPSKDIAKDLMAELPLRFLSEADHVIGQILPVLEKDRPDAILYDTLAVAGRLAAAKMGLPAIEIFTSYAANSKFSISRNFPAVPDEHPARVKAKNLAARFTRDYGVKHLDLFEIFEGTADLNIVLLLREFHPAGDAFDGRFVFTGAQIAPRGNTGTWRAPPDDRPLVYSSLGTLFNDWPEYYSILFEAVAGLPVNVVVSIGSVRPEALGPVPKNVTPAPYLPQLDVLARASVFITHAGTSSVMESIWYGVPMLGIPQMAEQGLSAQRIQELGLGKALPDKNAVTPESLRASIQDLLDNPAYRRRLEEFQGYMRDSGGYERTASRIIEFVRERTGGV